MNATGIAEHIHDDSEAKRSRQQSRFVSVNGIQNDEQHIWKWADEAKKAHIIEYDDLRRKQQYKAGDID